MTTKAKQAKDSAAPAKEAPAKEAPKDATATSAPEATAEAPANEAAQADIPHTFDSVTASELEAHCHFPKGILTDADVSFINMSLQICGGMTKEALNIQFWNTLGKKYAAQVAAAKAAQRPERLLAAINTKRNQNAILRCRTAYVMHDGEQFRLVRKPVCEPRIQWTVALVEPAEKKGGKPKITDLDFSVEFVEETEKADGAFAIAKEDSEN